MSTKKKAAKKKATKKKATKKKATKKKATKKKATKKKATKKKATKKKATKKKATKKKATKKKATKKKATKKKAVLKTVKKKMSVSAFLAGIDNETRRRDAKAVAKIFARVSGKRATMWGSAIVGYGDYHYKYDSGREGDFLRIGFSPRKQNLVLYMMPGYSTFGGLLSKLGKHSTGKACLYINKLEDVDVKVLEAIAVQAWKAMEKRYGK